MIRKSKYVYTKATQTNGSPALESSGGVHTAFEIGAAAVPAQADIRVLLVEKQALVRDALRALVNAWPGIEVVGEAESGGEATLLLAESHPDVLLLDLSLGTDGSDALELLTHLRKVHHHARVIVLADDRDLPRPVEAVLMGAAGVVLRNQTGSVLKKAIEKVHAGEVWLGRTLTASVLRELAGPRSAHDSDPNTAKINSLSGREREIVRRVCTGLTNRDIGERLSISEATVRHHLTSIYNKLSLLNRLELVIFAYGNGLDKPDRQLLLQN
jgi:two-component system nitrate/nitrite response regulator NarL